MPRGVVDFTFIRAPVKRIADVLSKGFPSGEHVYDLTPRWRVADCSRGVPFAHINGARREFPPAVEGEALLEIGIDRRTSPGGAVCTMWNIL